jgi:predicted nucleic acid-binding Zn ribbon protein
MQCPYCNSELEPNTVECKKCGAIRVTRRTTIGVFVGWAGMVVALIWVMLWLPVTFLPFLGYNMGDYPWVTLIIGTIVAAALLWYSKSTLHSQWISRTE